MSFTILIIAASTIASLAAYCIGYRFGENAGRADGWIEKYWAEQAAEKAKRDAHGRFKCKQQEKSK